MNYVDIDNFIGEGENTYLEFKRKVSSPEKIARTISAFANTKGGYILFGVDDDGTIIGVRSEKEEIELIFKHWKRDALLEELSRIGVPAGNVRKLDSVYNWEQTKSQGLIMEVNHSTLGPISIPGPALRMMGLGDIGHRPDPLAPPVLGEQSEEIRRWLENDE